jgi:hypothetical protein
MGGGIYSQDVAQEARSANREAFSYTPPQAAAAPRSVHPALNPFGKRREVNNETPIVVALDVTRSRGDDTKLMYDKLPMLMGQIELKGYVKNPGISFAAVGDADADVAPLQVGQFEGDNRLDEVLERIWIEEGGGGTGQESYELAAYFYSRTNCVRLAKGIGRKGYFFFVGDEGFYPKVDRHQVKRIIGDDLSEDMPSAEAFRRLQEKFNVFLIYPKKTFDQRKSDIDAEIQQRVKAAGGMYEGVDIRASLIWNNRNDLDLHVITPSGEHIYYASKKASCGGWLDVDMNVRGDTYKPVENVRWAKGEAKPGRYQIYVQNFAFHEEDHRPTEIKVEVEVNGEIRHYSATLSPGGETREASSVLICAFDYDPSQREAKKEAPKQDKYAQYSDDVILAQWASVIPRENILRVEDPKSIIDVLLGTLALREGATDLDGYADDMRARAQGDDRVEQVKQTLAALERPRAAGSVEGAVPLAADGGQPRGGRSRRL